MKFFQSQLFRLGLTLVSLILIVTLSESIWSVWQKGDVVRERQAELARIESENKALRKQLAQAQSPDFIEREARDKLGLTKPGESVVLMPPATAAAKMLEDIGRKPVPNWQQWWRLFF